MIKHQESPGTTDDPGSVRNRNGPLGLLGTSLLWSSVFLLESFLFGYGFRIFQFLGQRGPSSQGTLIIKSLVDFEYLLEFKTFSSVWSNLIFPTILWSKKDSYYVFTLFCRLENHHLQELDVFHKVTSQQDVAEASCTTLCCLSHLVLRLHQKVLWE